MRKISTSIPLDFAHTTLAGGTIPEIYQLGVPYSAVAAVTATRCYLQGDPIQATYNILIAGDATTAGVISVEGANDIVPQQGILDDFTPLGWAPILGASMTVLGNGTYLSPPFSCAYNFIQLKWTPSAGTTGTIQGVILWQGRV